MEEDQASASSLSVTGHDDTEAGLEERLRDWLESSGKRSELQAKLRAELFGAIQTELAFTGDLEGSTGGQKSAASKREKLLNWLVSQHLTSNKHWLTNSVFVRYLAKLTFLDARTPLYLKYF